MLSAIASAQETSVADSIYFYHQAKENIETVKWGIAQLVDYKLHKISSIELDYNYQKGDFRRAQQALKTSNLSFRADGISTINRFNLYGYFSFNRTWQDSLAFSQKGIEDTYQPYYYVAGKASVFERQLYLGGGLISYNILKDRLYIGTAVDYLYNTAAGSIDPRSSTTTFNLKFSPQISYKRAKSTYGLGVGIGYGDEATDISYKNSSLYGSTTQPDRISYINYGYGVLWPSQTNFIRRNSQTSVQANYITHLNKWSLSTRLLYAVEKQDNQYPKTSSLKNETFGIYQLESYQFNLQLNKKSDFTNQQFTLLAKRQNGDDEFVQQAARVYTFKATTLDMAYRRQTFGSTKRTSVEWLTALGYKDVYVRDAAADHTVSYTYLNPKLGGILYFDHSNFERFSAGLSLGARVPIQNEIKIPSTQIKYFTQGVVYHDHLYWASKTGEAQLQFNYITRKLINNFKTGFSLQSTYYRNFHTPSHNFATFSIPGRDYLDFNFKINLYF